MLPQYYNSCTTITHCTRVQQAFPKVSVSLCLQSMQLSEMTNSLGATRPEALTLTVTSEMSVAVNIIHM